MKIKRVNYSGKFIKDFRKAPKNIQRAFRIRLEIFLTDKFNPLLNNHSLTGKFIGHRSINISGDWRAIYREHDNGDIIYFDLLGTHSKLYK